MIRSDLVIDAGDLEAQTGWACKPEGACKGEVCVPLPPEARTIDGRIDLEVVAPRLGMPIVRDDAHGVVAVGPATVTGRALTTAVAPEVTLPDVDGNPFKLSTLRGQKVLLVAWASW